MKARSPHFGSVRHGAVILCASLAAAFASSCWHPTFDPMLSASEITISKLGEPTLYFSVGDVNQYGMENAWFLPPMVDLPANGLLVQDMGERIGFKSVSSIDPVNHSGWINNTVGYETQNSMGDAYLVQAYPDGTSNALVAANPAGGMTMTISPISSTGITLPTPASPAQFGMGTVAVYGVNQASIAAFAYDGTDPLYKIVSPWLNGDPGFMNAPVPVAITFSAGSQVTAPGKFLAAPAWLYLSCGMSDGSRAIFRWVNPPVSEPILFPENYGPLIGALSSDGRLLAEQDGIISVLDPDLNFLFKFPAGRLRFVHERFDGSTMKVVFTRTLFAKYGNHDDSGSLQVEVYEIPTASLENLAD